MSQQMYESESDVIAQTEAMLIIGKAFKCDVHALRQYYQIDYAAMRDGNVVAWIEFKKRNNASTAYPDYMVSFAKVRSLSSHGQASGLPAYLVVQWVDGMFYHEITNTANYKIRIGGRTIQRDPSDIEPMVHIPLKHFKKISK